MAAMSRRLPSLWYPEASCAQQSSRAEEGGRGSHSAASDAAEEAPSAQQRPKKKKTVIQRRHVPTVVVPPQSNQEETPQTQNLKIMNTYDTIEKVGEVTLLDLSPLPYQEDNIPPSKKYPNWFCGWTDEEHFDLHRNTTARPPPREVRQHTPAVSIRSIYGRSSFQSRRQHYKFQHFTSYEEYADEYRQDYSYTSMFVVRETVKKEQETRETTAYKVVNERSSVVLPVEIRNVYQKDPYYAELVSRLGIKEPPKSRGGVVDGNPNLLRGLQPTPPSIVKKKRNVENIVVANAGKMSSMTSEDFPRPATTDGLNRKQSTARSSLRQASGTLPRLTQTTQISQYIEKIYKQHKVAKKKSSQGTDLLRNRQARSDNTNLSLPELVEEESGGMSDIEEHGEELEEELPEVEDYNSRFKSPRGYNNNNNNNKNNNNNNGLLSQEASGLSDKVQAEESSPFSVETKDHKLRDTTSKSSSDTERSFSNTDKRLPQLGGQEMAVETPKTPKMPLTAKNCLEMDPKVREKLISDTAYLLGVGSRDWAKTYMRKIMTNGSTQLALGRQENRTRPPTRQSRTGSRLGYRNQPSQSRAESRIGYRNQTFSRAGSRNAMRVNQEEVGQSSNAHSKTPKPRIENQNKTENVPVPNPPVRSNSRMGFQNQPNPSRHSSLEKAQAAPDLTAKTERKLEKLKSIYNPSISATSRKILVKTIKTQISSGGQTSRALSRQTSCQDTRLLSNQAPPTSGIQGESEPRPRLSRSVTQGGRATGLKPLSIPRTKVQRIHHQNVSTYRQVCTSITSLEGSGLYWNELPKPSRPPTSKSRQHAPPSPARVQGLGEVASCRKRTGSRLIAPVGDVLLPTTLEES